MKLSKSLSGTKLLAGTLYMHTSSTFTLFFLEKVPFSAFSLLHLESPNHHLPESRNICWPWGLWRVFFQLRSIIAFYIPRSSMKEGIGGQPLWNVFCRQELGTLDHTLDTDPFDPAGTFPLVCSDPEVLAKILCICWCTEKFRLQAFSNLSGR